MLKSHNVKMQTAPDAGAGGGGAAAALTTPAPATGAASLVAPAAPGTPPAAPVVPAANAEWFDSFKDPQAKEWLKAYKGAYPDAEAVTLKALNLEKFIGAEKAGRGVVAPKPDATPEEWKAFYSKVGGVPDKPDGYKIPDKIKADLAADPVFAKFQEEAHKMGMPPMFFEGVLNWYTSQANAIQEQMAMQYSKQAEQDVIALKTEWPGLEYDKNIELGRRALKAFVPHKDAEELKTAASKLEGALGTAGMLKFFANIGAGMSEHAFVAGEGTGANGGMTPEAARMKIAELKADKDWTAGYMAGHTDKRAEWERLHKIANPQQ